MVLSTPIARNSVVRDEGVNAFIHDSSGREPNAVALDVMKKTFWTEALFDQFSFAETSSRLRAITWLLKENFAHRHPELLSDWRGAEERFRAEVLEVAQKFKVQLERLLAQTQCGWPEDDAAIQERAVKGSVYFLEKLEGIFPEVWAKSIVETESMELRKRWNRAMQSLKESLSLKRSTLEHCRRENRFTASGYFYVRAKALVGESVAMKSAKKKSKSRTTDAAIPKTDTRQLSYTLYKSGKGLEEIARERSLAVATIEGHMVPYVASGEIPLTALVSPEKTEKIRRAFAAAPAAPFGEIKNTLGADFSYGELRLVQAAPSQIP
jgi:hypothetical protein